MFIKGVARQGSTQFSVLKTKHNANGSVTPSGAGNKVTTCRERLVKKASLVVIFCRPCVIHNFTCLLLLFPFCDKEPAMGIQESTVSSAACSSLQRRCFIGGFPVVGFFCWFFVCLRKEGEGGGTSIWVHEKTKHTNKESGVGTKNTQNTTHHHTLDRAKGKEGKGHREGEGCSRGEGDPRTPSAGTQGRETTQKRTQTKRDSLLLDNSASEMVHFFPFALGVSLSGAWVFLLSLFGVGFLSLFFSFSLSPCQKRSFAAGAFLLPISVFLLRWLFHATSVM